MHIIQLVIAACLVTGLLPAGAVADTRVVKVGVFPLSGFNNISEDGTVSGYNADYLKRIAQIAGWSYQYVKADSWQDALALLDAGEIDLLSPAQRTADRTDVYGFSAYDMGSEYGALLGRADDNSLVCEDFEAFDAITIGIVDGLVFKDRFDEYAAQNGFTPHYQIYPNTSALIAALEKGEVNAIVANLMVCTPSMKTLARFAPSPIYYLYQLGNYDLGHTLDEAMERIETTEPDFINNLQKKYFPQYQQLPLSREEISFVEHLGPLKVGCPSDMRPLSYVDDLGNVAGINKDILDKIAATSGLQFTYVPLPEGTVDYATLHQQGIDLLSCIERNNTNLGLSALKLSDSYLSTQKVLVGRRDTTYNLDRTCSLAVKSGSGTLRLELGTVFPLFNILDRGSIENCMDLVLSGDMDLTVQDSYEAEYYLSKPRYSELTVVRTEGLSSELSLSPLLTAQNGAEVDPTLSNPLLMSVLDKSIKNLDESVVSDAVTNHTLNDPYRYTLDDLLTLYGGQIALGIGALCIILTLCILMLLQRRRVELELRRNAERLENITNNIDGGVVVLETDLSLRITFANEGFLDIIHLSSERYQSVIHQSYVTYVHPEDVPTLRNLLSCDLENEKRISVRMRVLRTDNTFVPVLFNGTLTINEHGERELYCVIMDISEQVALTEALERDRKRFAMVIEGSHEIIYEINLATRETLASPLFKERFGWELKADYRYVDAEQLAELWHVHPQDVQAFILMAEEASRKGKNGECVVRIRRADGVYLWSRITQFTAHDDDGTAISVVGRITNVDTERKELIELEQRSHTDQLTGLLNKQGFVAKATECLREDEQPSVLLFMDLDNFKAVNDTFGHLQGDRVLKIVADKLRAVFSHKDVLARFGGDEFCLLVRAIPQDVLDERVDYLLSELRMTYHSEQGSDGPSVSISASVGIVWVTPGTGALSDYMEYADRALYVAKEHGKNCSEVYSN